MPPSPKEDAKPAPAAPQARSAAVVAALGIVYGDLGTSPLYAFQAIAKAVGGRFDETAALGSLSLVVWALIVIISIKYCLVVMRADNRGEGGILALMTLTRTRWRGRQRFLIVFGLIGAALIYGDGIITPAISVLSAVEGLNVATKVFAPFTMPIAAVILLGLFCIQRFGTAAVGRLFGPAMLVWFVTIALLGALAVAREPHVLTAIDPRHAAAFLAQHGLGSLTILGAVFLAVTGGEAMYAVMGHLGREPIRIAWFVLVLPALLLNYAGQTALVLATPAVEGNLFFKLAPDWALFPLVGLATVATVIASQAIITGSFSLTRQAMQLGWFPGMHIQQTSAEQYGQIYVPFINWSMMLATLALTVAFGSSDRLAAAYGMAVSITMLMTTALLYRVMRVCWHWRAATALAVFAAFLVVDTVFFAANLTKIVEGGWIPLLFGALVFTVMTTWRAGIDAMHRTHQRGAMPLEEFNALLRSRKIPRVPGTAIFFTHMRGTAPPIMVAHMRDMGSLHADVVALTVHFVQRPRVRPEHRLRLEETGPGFRHMVLRFGFVEVPNIPATLHRLKAECGFDPAEAIYFIERDQVVRKKGEPTLARWRRLLFAFLYRNAVHASDRFDLPPKQFVQVGRQVEV